MCADIFTKHFPETKRDVWNSNLKLISIFADGVAKHIDYSPSVVQSLRGDLDKPKVVTLAQVPPACKGDADWTGKPGCDDDGASTAIPDDDDRAHDFDDDTQFNDEWRDDDWTDDYDKLPGYESKQSGNGALNQSQWFDDVSTRPALAAIRSRIELQ